MTRSPEELFVVLMGLAILTVGLRVFADRFERGRRKTREMYLNASIPHYARVGVSVMPMIALAMALAACSALLPNPYGAVVLTVAVVIAGVSFVFSYRVPPPFMPRWMRDEIEDGRLELVRPEGIDWLQFWIVAPFIVLAPFAAIYLVVSGSAGP